VYTLLISSDVARIVKEVPAVLNVINNQGSVVDDFTEGGNVVDFFLSVTVEFGNEHAKNWSPTFSSSVKKIPNGFGKAFCQAVEMAVLFSVVEVVCQVLQILFVVEKSWDYLFDGLRFGKVLRILLQNLFDCQQLSFF